MQARSAFRTRKGASEPKNPRSAAGRAEGAAPRPPGEEQLAQDDGRENQDAAVGDAEHHEGEHVPPDLDVGEEVRPQGDVEGDRRGKPREQQRPLGPPGDFEVRRTDPDLRQGAPSQEVESLQEGVHRADPPAEDPPEEGGYEERERGPRQEGEPDARCAEYGLRRDHRIENREPEGGRTTRNCPPSPSSGWRGPAGARG